MRYAVVFVLSIGVGWLVYALTMRAERSEPATVGFEPPPTPPEEPEAQPIGIGAEAPEPGYTYLRVAVTGGPSIRERVQGLLGSLVLIVIGTIAVASAFYALGVLISRTIEKFLGE